MGFLSFLSPAITAASDVAGGYAQGQEKVGREQQQMAIMAIKQKRQNEQDAIMNALHIAQTKAAGLIPVGYQTDKEGNVIQVPSRAAGPTTPVAPSPATGTLEPVKPPAVPPMAGGDTTAAPAIQTPVTPTIGTPTGIKGRIPNDPNSPESIKADSVKSANAAKNQNQFGFHPDPVNNVYLPTIDSTGRTTYTTVKSKGAPNPQPTDLTKPTTAPGGGSRSLTPEAMNAMYDQAAHADAVMRAYENDYRAGKVKVHTGSQTLGAGTGAHSTGVTALLTGAEAAGSNALMGLTDPRYQEYLTAQKRFGNIMGNLMSKRYSEYQGTLDTQLAGLGANDAGPTLDLKQSYRQDLLNSRPKLGVAPTVRTGGPPGDINLGKVQQVRNVKSGDPTAGMADADAWEYWKSNGLTPAQATAKVQSRKK